jgi:flagellar L-ring protein precursor FlgH
MMRCGWILIGLPVLLQAQWGNYGARSLTSDLRATAVGDVVTILVVEDAQASNAAQTGEQRGSTLGLGAEGSFGSHSGRISGSFRSDAQFRGKGETSRSERIRARLTARVVAVDSLGHLVLEGRRTTRINGELQTIVLRGKVRPIDLGANNTVPSYALADLELLYEGDGTVTRAQEPGLIARLLRLLF